MTSRPPFYGPRLFRSLHCFEAVARHGSVAKAATELGVSASAVSHQLRELAATLGEELVVRRGRGIVLTATGRRLFERIGTTFADLEALAPQGAASRPQSLRLGVEPAFGQAWLPPRLPAFVQDHPRIQLELRLCAGAPSDAEAVPDVLVTTAPPASGHIAIDLFDEPLVAVTAGGPAGRGSRGQRCVVTTDREGTEGLGEDWRLFCRETGRSEDEILRRGIVRCSHDLLALALAVAGLGMALVPEFLAARPIANGSLIAADPVRLTGRRTYRLHLREAKRDDPAIRALAGWLVAQAGRSVIPFPPRGQVEP
ncbi:LysR family transcriptional regulator [Rubellimicrobium roseum]|uniref:LysR family transcriptional regulator n=1 Tax=Rubellimicrobium roseum TaxID=687525 RepID=A0A5C4NAX0_9RHOB|nr:LysR family transcriptional regulator [Rubellimicrobium roseum]TNC65376.1 LysR family transcriptional regulator [Rubellimicrobium roseum]